MGSNASKVNETASQIQKNNSDVGDNPDPRSPTPEIVRTPLQGKSGAKHNITKNIDLRKTFDVVDGKEKLIHNNPILSAVIKNHLQSYDPRSPSQDFDRTPIVLTSTDDEDKTLQKLQTETSFSSLILQDDVIDDCDTAIDVYMSSHNNVVPKNLCQEFIDLTLDNTLKDVEEPLGSSTASNEAIDNNMTNGCVNRPTELLETNFDYVENDTEEILGITENSDDVKESTFEMKNTPLYKVLSEDPRSPSMGIERTPIVVVKIDEDASPRNVEEMSDDTLIKVLQNTNLELRHPGNAIGRNNDGLLIYVDDTTSFNETPKKSKSTTNSGSRTPLSCMKNKDAGHNRSKSANTLYDPQNHKVGPCKMAKRISHIPRLKSLSKQSKFLPTTGSSISLKNISKTTAVIGDCENTPPHSHRDRWDKDNSIVL